MDDRLYSAINVIILLNRPSLAQLNDLGQTWATGSWATGGNPNLLPHSYDDSLMKRSFKILLFIYWRLRQCTAGDKRDENYQLLILIFIALANARFVVVCWIFSLSLEMHKISHYF
jgi:hypothetical protein